MAIGRRNSWMWIVGLGAGFALLGCMGVCATGFGLIIGAARWQAAEEARTIEFRQNVPYATCGGTPLVLDMARPKQGAGPFPAVVCIHGGGWRGGDKSSFQPFVKTLAKQGYVAITIKYRFAPAHRFPAQLEDAKSAVRYLRAHAQELNIDPDQIGAMGGSAGGHLALLLGATDADDGLEGDCGNAAFSSRVQAVASIAGPTDLNQPFPPTVDQMLVDLVGKTKSQDAGGYKRASPVTYLDSTDPPILAIHGTADPLVPYSQATLLISACKEAGINARLITVSGGGHGFGGKAQDWVDANAQMVKFFDEHLKAAQ